MTRRWRRRRGRTEGGFVALEYLLGMALLVFPVAMLVTTLPEWPSRSGVARQAATEAARTAVEQDDWSGATAAGQAAAQQVVANYGFDPSEVGVTLTGTVARGGAVTAHVAMRMPAIDVPVIGGVGEWTWTVDHTEKVDQYRSYP
jgi:hypothetical protein